MGQTVIEINGVKYDATTGGIITDLVSQPVSGIHSQKRVGHNIDGIVSAMKPTTALQPLAKPFKPSLDRQVHDISMVHQRQASKSQTLMREAVKKPTHSPKLAPINPTQISSIQPTSSYKNASLIDARMGRASNNPLHSDISKFSINPTAKLQPTMTHMPVAAQAAPANVATKQQVQASSTQIRQGSSDFIAAQLAKRPNDEESSPFKHKPLRKKISGLLKGKKLRSVAATASAGLLIGGFIAYQNLPSITLAMANRTAGISAKIPKGIPSNFAISHKIEASKGQVTLTFVSRTDDRQFTITQQTSDLNSSELERSLAGSFHKNYQTYDSNGIKLYITGPGEADWVDGGKRINLSGKTGLSSEQVATIARSL
jgi:hypothetical protein